MTEKNNKTSLDKKSISAIADQLEARLRQGDGKSSKAETDVRGDRGASKKGFWWGAASGVAVAFVVPLMGKQGRAAARNAIKGGIAAGRYVRRVASTVKEDVQDITAEAKADLEKESPENGGVEG